MPQKSRALPRPTFLTIVWALRVVKNQFQFNNEASREVIPASAKIACTMYCPVIV